MGVSLLKVKSILRAWTVRELLIIAAQAKPAEALKFLAVFFFIVIIVGNFS